ncbi:hypothetical protein NX80_013405 [Xanthomonas vasicola pv. arecae]|nr:hypothetical protein NX80_013405 [Xanthomonas vasicola pv. arecae]MBV7305092.1 hypothetical protein [Xanthomonas vasicola pv. vasculorum]TWQ17642.1 hypothetical protein FQK00_11925 [Xanthomonas vasicola]HHZ55236.1 hypothetical protein [Xanthomonas vasicola pv. zeae]TWQ33491.1 hypothetical protein FQJ99_18720 [Xanthomonas vasicola]
MSAGSPHHPDRHLDPADLQTMALRRHAQGLALVVPRPDSASVLFALYSYLVGNAVFIVSNVLILLTALTGYGFQQLKRRKLERVT